MGHRDAPAREGEEEGEGKGAGEEEGEAEEGSRIRSRETLAVPVPLGDFRFSIPLPFGVSKLCGACAPAKGVGGGARRLPKGPRLSPRARGPPHSPREHRARIRRESHSKPSSPQPAHFSLPFFHSSTFPHRKRHPFLLQFRPPIPRLLSSLARPRVTQKASLSSAAPPRARLESVGGRGDRAEPREK